MVCCLESQVERARGYVGRVCCHGVIGPESGRGGTNQGSCLTGNKVFPRIARGSLAGSQAQRHGTRLGTMDSLGGDAHSPCRKWRLHMARLRRVGLVGSLAHDNAEGSSALLGHAGIENRICRIILSEPGVFRGEEGSTLRDWRHEDPDSSTCFVSILLTFHPSFHFEGGGVSGKRMVETPLPLHTPGTR